MGLFGGGNSSSTSNTTNNDNDHNTANYGDGLTVSNQDAGVVTVNYLGEDLAVAAIEEAGMFAETVAAWGADAQKANIDLVEGVLGNTKSMFDSALGSINGLLAQGTGRADPNKSDSTNKMMLFGLGAVALFLVMQRVGK